MRTKHRISDRTIAMHCCRAYALLLLCAATAIASPAQTFTSLFSFDYGTDGAYPGGGAGPGHQWGPLRDNARWRGQGGAAMARSSRSRPAAG